MATELFLLGVVLIGVVFVTWIGVRSGRGASGTIEGWIANDRTMGPVLTWFLLGTEIYTAFTFLGLAGFAYINGGGAFYNVATNDVGYALGFFVLPAIGLLGRRYGYLTQSDFIAGRYKSKALGIAVSFCTAIIMIAYIDLNIEGLGAVLRVLTDGKINILVADTIGFSVLSVAVFFGGIRGNAWQSVIKDMLMFGSIAVLFIVVPYRYFGGFGAMFHELISRAPHNITMPGPSSKFGLSWFWTTVLVTGFGQWMWPQWFNVAFSARSSDTLKLQAVFMPLYQLVKVAVIIVGFAAILIFAGHKVSGNDIVLLLAKQAFPPGLLALFALAAVLSAIVPAGPIIMMSCTLLARNVYGQLRPGLSTQATFRITRALVFVVTFMALILAVAAQSLIVTILLLAYDFIAQLLPGVIIGGLFWRRATGTGMAAGLATGWIVTTVLLLTKNDPVWGLNAGFVALIANCAVFWVVSLVTKPVSRDFIDPFFQTLSGRRVSRVVGETAAIPKIVTGVLD
jgi:solute:Na+ symporter, SSS family